MEQMMHMRKTETDQVSEAHPKVKLTTLAEKMSRLPEELQEEIRAEARTIIAEELSLQDLRKARKMTQTSVAAALGINQENVSRLERRSDFLISSLRSYIEAMGGKLNLVVDFPDRPPVAIEGITDLDDNPVELESESAMVSNLADGHSDPVSNARLAMKAAMRSFYDSSPEVLLPETVVIKNFGDAAWDAMKRGIESFAEIEETYMKMIETNNSALEAYSIGNAHMEKAEYGEALQAFERVLDLNPDNIPAFAGSGLAHIGMEDFDKAGEIMSELVKFLPPESYQEDILPDKFRSDEFPWARPIREF